MKNSLLTLAIILQVLMIAGVASAQYRQTVPPTPNAMKMTEFYAQRPNMYTGTANVSIPLYSISFGGWDLPLSISYNATGIRTNEDASEIGLGWALNATAVISRTIRGGDDLYEGAPNGGTGQGYCYNTKAVTTDMGYDYRTQVVPPTTSYYWYLVHTRPDTEPDIFNYNFFGYSGSFVLSQKITTNDSIKVIKLTEDATAISLVEGSKTFRIITPEGFKGEFMVKERSTTLSAAITTIDRMQCCAPNNIDIDGFVRDSGRFRTTSSWYLNKITSPYGEEINFIYDLVNGNSAYLSKSIAFSELKNSSAVEACIQTIHEHVYLTRIQSPDVQVDFTMENRDDVRKNDLFVNPYAENDPAYTNWKYFNPGQTLKRYTGLTVKARQTDAVVRTVAFKQSYFNGLYYRDWDAATEQEAQMLRGRLDRVLIDDQEYRFTYENGANGVPNKLTRGIDHFGFYNGQDNVAALLPPLASDVNGCDTTQIPPVVYTQRWERRVDFNFGKAGLLNKVIYPTRGYTLFTYKPHRYLPRTSGKFKEQPGAKDAGGARIESIEDYNYDNVLVRKKQYRYVNDADAGYPEPAEVGTTGKLMTELYHRYIHEYANSDDCFFLYASNTSIPGNNAAEGKVIGYSKVHELVMGAGSERYRNTYYFENTPMEVTNYNTFAEGDPNLNGQLKQTVNYNSNNEIIQVTSNTNYKSELGTILALSYSTGPGELQFASSGGAAPTFLEFSSHYKITRSFHTPRTIKVSTSANSPSNMAINVNGELQAGATVTETTKDLGYNGRFLLKYESFTNSKNEILRSDFKRAHDYPSAGVIAHMRNPENNLANAVIEETLKRNGTVISAKGNKYALSSPGKVNLVATYSYNPDLGPYASSANGSTFPEPYEVDVEYLSFNSIGRPLEIKGSDGVIQSFIWGYNDMLPVASAKGASHASLLSAYNAASGNELALRSNSLVAKALITTYKHSPLVGVTEITDPNARKVEYIYDNHQRLSKLKDNEGNTVEQYQYNFKPLALTRVMTITGSLSFGSFYACDGVQSKTIVITNTGNDNLRVISMNNFSQFTKVFNPITIGPGESVPVTLTFTGTVAGAYAEELIISSDKTSATGGTDGVNNTYKIPVTATLNSQGAARVVWLDKTEIIAPTSNPHEVVIRNDGNSCMEITGASGLPAEWNIDWGGALPFFLSPTKTRTVTIRRIQPLTQTHEITINATNGTGSNTITLYPDYSREMLNLPTTVAIPQSANVSTTYDLPITNVGNDPLTMGSVSITGSQMFSVTYLPSNVVPRRLNGVNGSITARITFAPGFNFAGQNATIAFNSNRTNSVNSTIQVSGQRTSIKSISVPSPVTHDGGTATLVPVVITNTGNDNVTISSTTTSSTAAWALENPQTIPGVISPTPGANTKTIYVRKQSTEPNESFSVTLNYDNSGSANFVTKTTRRNQTLAPATLNFTNFTGPSQSQDFTITNYTGTPGVAVEQSLVISSMTSNDPQFTLSETNGTAVTYPITLTPGTAKTIRITYTPTNFSLVQNKTITISSNMTSGSTTLTVSGQRTSVKTISVVSSVTHDGTTATDAPVTITNTGNDNVTISSLSKPSTNLWSISNEAEMVGAVIPPAPGANTKTIYVRKLSTEPNESYTVGVNYDNSQNASFTAKTTRRNQTLSSNNLSFTGFTGASQSQDITITNYQGSAGVTVDQTLAIYSITSNDDKFTITETNGNAISYPLAIAPGGSKTVRITYTTTDFTNVQSKTVTVFSNMTSGGSAITVSGKRDQLFQASLSTTSLIVKPSTPTATATLTNTGNSPITISALTSSGSTNSYFSVSMYQIVSFSEQPVPANFVLQPGASIYVKAQKNPSGDYSSATGSVTVQTSQNGSPVNYAISLFRQTF